MIVHIELKIQSLSKEVTKVPLLEEEIESLTRFETELDNVNRESDRLVARDNPCCNSLRT